MKIEVDSFMAIQMVVKWQADNHIPDGYCPQKPVLTFIEGKELWKVDIYLTTLSPNYFLVGTVYLPTSFEINATFPSAELVKTMGQLAVNSLIKPVK